MEKTIFDVMSSDERRVDAFLQACDELMHTQYILVDAKISGLLQTIASSTILYSIFGNILRDFDYKAVAKSCLKNGNTEFCAPNEPTKIVALVFCILLDMDKKNIELHDFLRFFKRGADANSAFENFLNELILPFKNSVIYLYNESQKAVFEGDQTQKGEREIVRTIMMFAKRVEGDTNLSSGIKEYFGELFDTLIVALKANEKEKARPAYSILLKRLKDHKPTLAKELETYSNEIN